MFQKRGHSLGLSSPQVTGRLSLLSSPRGRTPSNLRQSLVAEDVLEETDAHIIKAKNSPVPVQVQEVLRHDSFGTSLKIHQSGWAWLVSGQRVYFWRHSLKQHSTLCYRLTLPTNNSVASWNAMLIDVHITHGTSNIDGVFAISPEGSLRYWRGVSEDIPYRDLRLELGGERSHSLTKLERADGYIVLSTSGNMFLLRLPSLQDPLVVVPMVPNQGVLSGISKRVSSLFFGGQTIAKKEAVQLVTWYSIEHCCDIVHVLTDTHIQCWRVQSTLEQDQEMLLEFDVHTLIRDGVQEEQWFADAALHKLWLLDMEATNEGVVILFAVANSTVIKYGLITLPYLLNTIPLSCTDKLTELQYQQPYQHESEAQMLSFLLQGCVTSSQLAVYNRNTLLPVFLKRLNEGEPCSELPPDKVDIHKPNAIIGSGVYEGELLFFTLQHGIISLNVYSPSETTSPPKRARPSFISSGPSRSLPHTSSAPPPESMREETEQLQNAFMLYLNNNLTEATSLCSRIFSPASFLHGLDTPGDIATKRLSENILNDPPSADPRWSDTSATESVGSGSSSIIILYQLEDKLEAHRRLTQFLTDVGLLDMLTCVTVRGGPMLTRHLLCEHAEKIMAAIVLKKMHNQHVEEAIKHVLQERPPLPHLRAGLTSQDIFYSQVVNIDEVVKALVDYHDTAIYLLDSSVQQLLVTVNLASIIKAMFYEGLQYRSTHAKLYQSCNPTVRLEPEFIPWTACEGNHGSRETLRRILFGLLDHWDDCRGEPLSDSDQQTFWNIYTEMAVIVYSGLTDHLKSIKKLEDHHRQFEIQNIFDNDKNTFITAALKNNQVSVALQLAEQYCHFPTLIQVCEDQDNRDMLKGYFDKFNAQGFGDFLFKHYLDNGDMKRLLSFSTLFPNELGEFLSSHPHLSWLHDFAIEDYSKASKTLLELAEVEDKFVARKKTMLSLSKLSLLASSSSSSETENELEQINSELKKIEFQEAISHISLENADIDPNNMPPLPADKIIELHLEDDNPGTLLLRYHFALEYLNLTFPDTNDPEYKELQVYIWSQAALKTDWTKLGTDDPLKQLQQTFFFKVLEEYNMKYGYDVMELLPSIDDLVSSHYLVQEGLSENSTFLFLMKAGYEHLERIADMSFDDASLTH